jgi:hypothetical protein
VHRRPTSVIDDTWQQQLASAKQMHTA